MPPPQISPFLRDCIVHDDAGDSGINADALTRKGRAFPGLRMTGPAAVDSTRRHTEKWAQASSKQAALPLEGEFALPSPAEGLVMGPTTANPSPNATRPRAKGRSKRVSSTTS
jgi:hypothetical protein